MPAAPRAMIARLTGTGIEVAHPWGMTETSPVGTSGALPEEWETWPPMLGWTCNRERPLLLLVVRKSGSDVDEGAILAHLARHVAKRWLPDAIRFVGEPPHTAIGKLLKTALRERYGSELPSGS